ncbi:MAG TPA: ABC-F family ATP-binding cassette domain-containing protein [Gemmatimonadaceae bacterium]|nr:ABC-F family ATP-binding cassette domain-containing protein [Gemmatimonadaceae bacterium]
MTILSLSAIRVDFGATTLLRDVTFTVGAGECWGIVGRNGAGKTTLFRLISNAMQPTSGAVARAPGLRFALLDQYRDFGDAATIWEAAAQGYREVLALERRIAEQAERLAVLGSGITEADLERFGRDQERFAHMGGYDFHARVDAVVQGLGFDAEEAKTRSLDGLSGGERGRVGLAAQLAAPADVVLLDEPTNHLDLDTIDWLKRYLREFGETVLVISHDRAFLDETVDHVLHVAHGTATAYRGGYSAFVTQRAERMLTLERQVAAQRRMIAKEEDYIRRNIAGQNSAQAKGRRTRLERLPRLSPPPSESETMALRFDAGERGGDQVIVAEKLGIRMGDRWLVRDFTAVARRGDVIALVGPNGAGKTMLLATLLGRRTPTTGSARLGGGITAEWFRQDMAQVPADQRMYDCIADRRPMWTRGQIQGHLGRFGFSGDEVLRSTATLSGGEKARIALALMMLSHANLLVLDEPTNHLDVESIEALEDALDEYGGTVVLVSHDRAVMRELATRVWAFEGDRLVDFDGPFVEWESRGAERAAVRQAERAREASSSREVDRRGGTRAPRRDGKAAARAKRDAEQREQDVQDAEARVAELEAALADGTLYDGSAEGARRAGGLTTQLAEARAALDAAMERWLASVDGG